MNLCRPDKLKSCAACCGLYNVPDARRRTLLARLDNRTHLFRAVPRSIDLIDKFRSAIRESEPREALEPMIHVCEFAGFVDDAYRIVGCMLHPTSPGNGGVDLRGLCHYGSMACKAFFCPAWKQLPPNHVNILVETLDDWHLYGLVITDVDFVEAVFGLLEARYGPAGDWARSPSCPAAQTLREVLAWKDSWPLAGSSTMRRSRYYFNKQTPCEAQEPPSHMDLLINCLKSAYGIDMDRDLAEEIIVQRFLCE